jgi:hypothetical protein
MLLDVEPPSLPNEFPGKYGRTQALVKLIRVMGLSIGQPLNINTQKLGELDAATQLRELLRAMQEAKLLPHSAKLKHVHDTVRVFSASLNTVYVPERGPIGAAHLFQAQEQLPPDEDDDETPAEEAARRWGLHVERIRVWQIPGNHITLLRRPNIDYIASHVREVWGI